MGSEGHLEPSMAPAQQRPGRYDHTTCFLKGPLEMRVRQTKPSSPSPSSLNTRPCGFSCFAEGHTQGSWDPRLWAWVSPPRPKPWSLRLSGSETITDCTSLELCAADVILDPDTAHPNLRISEDQRSLQYTSTWQNLPENPKRFQDRYCVLGRESFTSGRHFWEVEVEERKQWQFGVCRENVQRKYYVAITPQNGFWTIALLGGHDFQARTDPRSKLTIANPPKRVGVFLDYENGEVSFYDAINGSHIFTFSHASFSGALWPVFKLFSEEPTALTICPAQECVGNSLVSSPLPGLSLGTRVASGPADGNEDPQAELQPLLAHARAEGLLNNKTSQQEHPC